MSVYIEKTKKTKLLIQQSFLRILETKAFDSITIGDITKEAKINRGTFYLHYLDKFDLLDKIEEALFEGIGSYIDELQKDYTLSTSFNKSQEQLATALFEAIQQHAPILRIFLSDHGRAGFHLRFKQAFSSKVQNNIENMNEVISKQIPLPYFISFITSAFLGLIEEWIRSGLDKSPSEMTNLYIQIIKLIQQK